MTSQNILAIDIGTKMGWAFRSKSGIIKSGSEEFKKTLHPGRRFQSFRRWLTETKKTLGDIDHVYYEKVEHHVSTYSGQVYGGFFAILAAWCAHHDIEITGVGVGTIKKHAAGHGKADKEQIIAAMKSKGFKPKNDDEADALALLLCKGGA
jgi:crossover junction endodeoxyribonuclease RuvC